MTPMVFYAMELDSPLEALPFDFLNFGLLPLVNNVWTWIAVITAAICFWRFKAVAVSSPNFLQQTAPSPPPPPPAQLQEEKTLEGSETHACEPTPAPSPLVSTQRESFDAGEVVDNLVAETMKKQKYTLYYEEVEKAAEKEEEVQEEWVEEWWKRWEEALGTRRGEKGWYRYQRLGGLNGSVVRLWDGNGQWAS